MTEGIGRLIEDVLGAPASRGRRRAVPLQATIERQLDRADIELLWKEPPGKELTSPSPGPSQKVSPIQRLRTSHHMLAKLVAEGRKGPEIQLITGYSSSYISNIKSDPSFNELVTYYREQIGEVYLNVHQRLASLGLDVVDEIQERLNTDPDSFSLKDLEEIGKMTLDRSGFGPQSTVNHKGTVAMVTPDHLARIKDEVGRSQQGKTIPLVTQNNPQSKLGQVIEHEPLAESAVERNSSTGADVSEKSREAGPGEVL